MDCGTDWTAENGASDLFDVTADSAAGTLSITTLQTEPDDRLTGTILLSTAGQRIAFATLTVVQEARDLDPACISADTDLIEFFIHGGSATVTVESNYDWDFSTDASDDWLSVTRDGSVLTVTADSNTGEDAREAVITLTATQGTDNTAQCEITVSEAALTSKDIVFSYYFASGYKTISLPIDGEVDCIVDWGDGTVENITEGLPLHTYKSAGEYEVVISGTVTALHGLSVGGSIYYLTAIKQWGSTGLTDLYYAFNYCGALTYVAEAGEDTFAKVESFCGAFNYCTGLTSLPEGLFGNCPAATDFYRAFANCTGLLTVPENLFAGCPNAVSFQSTFNHCTALTEIPEGLFAHCPELTDATYTFNECTALTSIPEGLFANNSKINSFYRTFYGLYSLLSIPAGLFKNCPEVTSFERTFANCYVLESIPDGLFDFNPVVTSFEWTFYYCQLVTSVPDGLFAKCPDVTSFEGVFQDCWALKEIPEDIFAKCPEVTSFSHSFRDCFALLSPPAGLFAANSKVTTFDSVFSNCQGMQSVPVSLFDNCPKVESFYQAFFNCKAVEGVESPYTEIEGEKVHLYQRTDYPGYFGVESIDSYQCFWYCKGFTDYEDMPERWI